MVREDIVGGLKNALDRGASIESARLSFVNAGYSEDEVNEAVNFLGADSVLLMKQQPPIKKPQDSIQPSKNNKPPIPSSQSIQKNNESSASLNSAQQKNNKPLITPSPAPQKNIPLINQPIVEKEIVFKKEPVIKKEGRGFFMENWKIIALISILVILIVVFVLVLLFSNTIASWFA